MNSPITVDVFSLMKAGHFPRYQDCTFLRTPSRTSIVVLFSHRWETLGDPDPDRIQFHGAVRFIITACMMAMGSTPNVFNGVDFSEIILSPVLFQRLAAEHRKLALTLQTPEGMRAFQADEELTTMTGKLLEYLVQAVGPRNGLRVMGDAPFLAHLMRNFSIWYDYTSMPQEPRSFDEETVFEEQLSALPQLLHRHETVILWSKASLKRAWCFLEAAISVRSNRYSIFSSENSLASSAAIAPIHERSFGEKVFSPSSTPLEFREQGSGVARLYRREQRTVDLSSDLTFQLSSSVREATQALLGKDVLQMREYLHDQGYQCTRNGDIYIIARALAAHYSA